MLELTIENIIKIINNKIDYLNITSENVESDLSELGVDSITFVQIIVLMEEEYDCEIPDSQLSMEKLKTINDIFLLLSDLVSTKEK